MTKSILIFALGFIVAILMVYALLFKGNKEYVKISVRNVYNLDNYKLYNKQRKNLNDFFTDTSYQCTIEKLLKKTIDANNNPSFGMQAISDSVSKLYINTFTDFLATNTIAKNPNANKQDTMATQPWIWIPIDQFIAYANYLQLAENQFIDSAKHSYKTDGVRIYFGKMDKTKLPTSLLANNQDYYNNANGAIIPLFFSTYTDSVFEKGQWVYRLTNNSLTPAADCNCGYPPRCTFNSKPCSRDYCTKCPGGIKGMQTTNSYIVDFFTNTF